jgi:SAM-dependent methyltransferase
VKAHAPAPQIFTHPYYQRLYELEERHWWSVGMRAIAERLLAPYFRAHPNLRALDAGCGTGGTLTWLEGSGASHRVVGIDFSRYALEFCRKRRKCRVAQASITQLPFADRSFDLVICTDVIQHLPRNGLDRTALRECHRVLRPGGVLFLRTNVRLGSQDGTLSVPATDPDYHQYSRPELAGILTGAGFTVKTISYVNMLPALVATWIRRLRPAGARAHRPGANPGLGMRVPPRWLNAVLKGVMRGEAWYLARGHRTLAYGHSLISLAMRPVMQARGESLSDGGTR